MNIFILDYDFSIYEFYINFFKIEFPKVQVHYYQDKNHFLSAISQTKPELAIIEFEIEKPFEVFQILIKNSISFIVVSRIFSERVIVESLKHGAYDYVHKSNLKYDYFKNILARAFLDLPRWHRFLNELNQNHIYPEFQKYDVLLMNLALESNQIEKSMNYPLPVFEEGKSYTLNFLTVRIPLSNEFFSFLIAEEELHKLQSEWILYAMNLVEKYNGKIWIKKSDSFTAVFHYKNYLDPILLSLEIKTYIIEILANLEIENLPLICALEQGTVIYNHQKENLYSEAINLTFHIVEKLSLDRHLYITKNIYDGLSERAKKYFFKEESTFESKIIYHFEYIS